MKYLKFFEKINEGEPEVDNYVLVNINNHNGEIWQNYINNSIGKVIKKNYNQYIVNLYIVEYSLTDYIIDTFLRQAEIDTVQKYITVNDDGNNVINMHFTTKEITKWSKDKNELEAILVQKKYNL
jgi:hypothetical protein